MRHERYGQTRSRIATIAKGKRHRAQAVESSEAGLSKAAAAARVGMKVGGLNALLRREFGSEKWPIAGHEPAQDAKVPA